MTWRTVLVFPQITLCVTALSLSAERRELDVFLVLQKEQYVVGEPVLLDVRLKNLGTRDLPAWVDALSYQIETYVRRGSGAFLQYSLGDFDLLKISPSVESVAPGQSKRYTLRILYTWYSRETRGRRSRLAFETPGEYDVKVVYPLFPKRDKFESNVIQIRVVKPEGTDATVWARLNHRDLLHFLQTGVDPETSDVVDEILYVLTEFPNSTYCPAIRWALENHYRNRTHARVRRLPDETARLEKIRETMRIASPNSEP